MLTGSNDNSLRNNKCVNPEYVFFTQRWQEMLDSRTLDTYRYNILNSYVACLELRDVIDKTLSGLLTSRQNVDDVKEEALDILKTDDVIIKHNKPLFNMLARVLGYKIEAKPGRDSIDDKGSSYYISLNRIKHQLMCPIKKLEESYFSYLIDELRTDILSGNHNSTQCHMSSLVSQCIHDGWSSKGLFDLYRCFEGDASLDAKWSTFVDCIKNTSTTTFDVYYSIILETRPRASGEDVRATISALGFSVKKGSVIISDTQKFPVLCSKIHADKNYIVLHVNSPDHHSAALCAINRLNSRISVATFYNMISSRVASDPNIITFNTRLNTIEAMTIEEVFRTYDYVDSNNQVFADTNAIFGSDEKSTIRERISSAFSYTNLSRLSYYQETKYITLWIALESLMRTGQYSDIISHIKNVLPEALCIRYLYRIVRNFAEDCARCGFKQNNQLGIDMQQSNKKDLVEKLIKMFRDQANYPALLSSVAQNSLLTFRCEEIHGLLCDQAKICGRFDAHITKVRRHIQRMYRIRNEIAHSAFKTDNSLVIYVEHLYTYLAQLMSEIVYYIEHKNAGSLEEAFATITESYNTYTAIIKDNGIAINDVLPNGIIEIF